MNIQKTNTWECDECGNLRGCVINNLATEVPKFCIISGNLCDWVLLNLDVVSDSSFDNDANGFIFPEDFNGNGEDFDIEFGKD